MPAMRFPLAAMLVACSLSGCVSTTIEPAARTDLVTARAGEDVQLEWSSQVGMLYTITASDTMGAGAQWKPLPRAVRLPGTGRRMSLSDRVPGGRPRYYDILIEPAAAAAMPQRSRATKTPNSGR